MPTVIAALGLLSALLLIVAEFTTLYSVNVAGRYVVAIRTVTAGAHNSYALLPIAVLAGLLTVAAYRTGSRAPMVAIVILGLVAILIAVVGDLPDTHAHGVTQHNQVASNSAGLGLYLETLGGVLLLLTGGLGLAAFGSGPARHSAPGSSPSPPGSRSSPPAPGPSGPGSRPRPDPGGGA